MLRICLLGPFQVERDGQMIPPHEWARPKDRAVLKLLALNHGHLVPQDHLLDALWPELGATSAARSLHVAVSRLRKLLGPAPLVRREPAGYTLASTEAVWIDVEEFRRLLDRAREWRRRGAWGSAAEAYRAAVALYRGDLCEDDPYAEWALGPREQLQETQLGLLEEAAECLVQVGTPAEAIELCMRGLAQDRTREGLYVQLLHAHAAAGHLADALQVYEHCRQVLAAELGVAPGLALRATHAAVLSGAPRRTVVLGSEPAARSGAAPPERRVSTTARPTRDGMGRLHLPCVGREGELAYLAAQLGAAQAGQGQVVLLHGEPGIGKSRLLEELRQLAASRAVRQLSARCYELERDLPYAPIVDAMGTFLVEQADPAEVPPALGQWGAQLAALLPSLRALVPDLPRPQPLRPDAERAALLAGLTHLLGNLARSRPLVLLLDDLHWADASTVQWLHYLTRRLQRVPLLIVGTYRSNDLGPDHALQRLLESLAGDPAAPSPRELRCLEVEYVAALLPEVSGSAARAHTLAERLYHETDGHPLFLVETLRTLLETGVLQLDEQGGWQETGAPLPPERRLPLPPTLREAILWRVRRLNEQERRVLLAAAVIARGFRPALLERMTELTSDAVLDALETLVGRQLVRLSPGGNGFDFRHELIQQAVYADLSPHRRRALHERAAAALEAWAEEHPPAVQGHAGELAHHWQQAEQWAPAVRYALHAGDHARAAFAPREALTHYRRAAESADHQPDLLTQSDRAGLLERLGRAYADLGEFDAAVRQFTALRELAQSLDDRLLDGRALLALADAHYWRHAFDPAERLAAEALGRAEELGNRGLRAGSLATAASLAMAQGRTDEAERHCGAVLALAGERPPAGEDEEPLVAGARLHALGWLGMLREFQGEHDRAMPAIDGSLRLGRELHNPFLTGRSRFGLGMSLGNRGRYEEALATLHEALRLAEEAGDRYWLPRLPNTIGWVYSELGDVGQAAEWNQRSITAARETGWLEAEANARVNLGGDALRRGDQSRAREELEGAAALIGRDEWFTWRYRMRLLVALGELALVEGAPEQALSYAQQALAVAEPTGSRKHAGRAWLLGGRALLAAGAPPAEALAQLEQARSLARACDNPPLLWSSAHELAALHARLGHEAAAVACLAEARAAIEAVASDLHDPAQKRCFLGAAAVQRTLAGV